MADESNGESNGDSTAERMPAAELATAAKESMEALTGFRAEAVSALQWDEDKWLVTVDICELERIPNTTDVLATYVVELDEQGGLLGYKRTQRYVRGQTEGV